MFVRKIRNERRSRNGFNGEVYCLRTRKKNQVSVEASQREEAREKSEEEAQRRRDEETRKREEEDARKRREAQVHHVLCLVAQRVYMHMYTLLYQ